MRTTHEDYIRAGAEVIIANTFGSTRQMLEPAGFGAQVETVNRRAVQLAIEARENAAAGPVAVAGSISTTPAGFDRQAYFSPAKEIQSYREAAGILADAGADLVALEMMQDTEHAPQGPAGSAGYRPYSDAERRSSLRILRWARANSVTMVTGFRPATRSA